MYWLESTRGKFKKRKQNQGTILITKMKYLLKIVNENYSISRERKFEKFTNLMYSFCDK